MTRHATPWRTYTAAAAAIAVLCGCSAANGVIDAAKKISAPTTSAPSAASGTALNAVNALHVNNSTNHAGYKRSDFGKAWDDNNTSPWGHNGCDTRNDVLKRDLTAITFKNSAHCSVKTGTLSDPYTGNTIRYTRGKTTSSAVQIDHVVALGNAWASGASRWDTQTKTAYANDPLVLLAVDGPTNVAKGDKDAAQWMPPARAFRPCYVALQAAIKTKYNLTVTQAEKNTMIDVLRTQPSLRLPSEPGGKCS